MASTRAKGVRTRTVAFALSDIPSSVRSPKQLPCNTSATVPIPLTSTVHLPCSSTKRVPTVLPSITTVSPAKRRRLSPPLATSLTKPRSQPLKRFSELATSVRVRSRSLRHSAASISRSVQPSRMPGNRAMEKSNAREGKRTASTSVFARTVADRGISPPMRLISPTMAPARSRPIVSICGTPLTTLTFFSTVVTPSRMRTIESPASPISPSETTLPPLGTVICSPHSAIP
mmetsp:Transcript_47864/g.86345  ORF Transcript_47864/g.86345 Transcript_47864/m.86345 type:complete len:231 (+) Transcript_47864:3096-3788(+)